MVGNIPPLEIVFIPLQLLLYAAIFQEHNCIYLYMYGIVNTHLAHWK